MDNENSKKKILFGAGYEGKRALNYFGQENVYCFCDNNCVGEKIISFEELKKIHEDYDVVVSVNNPKYCDEITCILRENQIKYKLFADIIKDNYLKGVKSAFTTIYKTHAWGGEGEAYSSGNGSHDPEIINPYINFVDDFITLNAIKTIVEVGCGDFNVMNNVMKRNPHVDYYGVDVVEELIERNCKLFGRENIKFCCIDACEEELPPADIIIIRQVLQHLDNARVAKILTKISNYKFALITEHIYEGDDVIYNIDKPIDEKIRLEQKSGVFIEHSPYNVQHVAHVLKIPSEGGFIRTSLIMPSTE